MTKEISNTDEIIDSRDVIERIEELESDLETLKEEYDGDDEDKRGLVQIEQDIEDVNIELKPLKALAGEASGYAPDWECGECLIHRDYFVKYCEELLEDIGALPAEIPGYIVIDMDATADNLEADYTTVDFDGQEYLIR